MQPAHPEKGSLLYLCRAPHLSVWLAFHKLGKVKEIVGRIDATGRPCGLGTPETRELESQGHYKLCSLGQALLFHQKCSASQRTCTPVDFSFFSSSWPLAVHYKMPLGRSPSHTSSLNPGFQTLPLCISHAHHPLQQGAMLVPCPSLLDFK